MSVQCLIDESTNQLRTRHAASLKQARIHTDLRKTRHGIDFVQKNGAVSPDKEINATQSGTTKLSIGEDSGFLISS